jgi:hypothetical protein
VKVAHDAASYLRERGVYGSVRSRTVDVRPPLKTVRGASPSRVRIPLLPPNSGAGTEGGRHRPYCPDGNRGATPRSARLGQRGGPRVDIELTVAAAVASILAIEVLENRWGSLDCGDPGTRMLHWLQWAMLVSAAVGAVLGVIGLFATGARQKLHAAAAITVAFAVVVVAIIVPLRGYQGPFGNLGVYTCSEVVA